jgi:hypothetical protein
VEPEGYEIRVQGHLERRRIRTFEGLMITHQANGETLISGPIQDQAALYGLLNWLRDLGIPLLSVNPLLKKSR